ncbi:MAG TPA: hypothetical protein DCP36_18430 [Sporomusaceae bacterium]|nr:hypothetical protein [Sporomusaceae bacterium]
MARLFIKIINKKLKSNIIQVFCRATGNRKQFTIKIQNFTCYCKIVPGMVKHLKLQNKDGFQ